MQQPFSLNPEEHTILAVDDKPLNLRLLRQMLEQEAFNVITAEHGQAALELLAARETLPDLILLDINMPVMNGFETCRNLQATPRTQSIPIIFVSGVSELEDKIAAFQEGAVDYITKPFQVDEVIARVSTHLTLRNLRRTLEAQILELERTQEELEASNRELARLSVQDSLTNLYNRRYLDENLRSVYSRARRYGKSLSIMVCDIDNFKQVNDTFSHDVGDKVIQVVADVLQTSVRDADIVARYGGEEFVVVFPETLVNNAAIVCERIRKQVKDYTWAELAEGLAVTLSMGLSGNITFESHEKMLADADKKMYESKVNGKNRVSW